MHLTKPILRLLLAGAVSIAALVAAPVAHAAAPGTKKLTVTLVDGVYQNPDASRWGRVTSSPAGIDCPGDCQEDFPQGSTVTFTLTPTPGYALGYWDLSRIGGGVQDCGENLVCTLQIGQGDAAQLRVSLSPQATLNVTPEGAGAVTISPPEAGRPAPPCTKDFGEGCSQRYPKGTRVTVRATPDPTVPEARFVRWSDYRCPTTGRSCTLTMDGEQYLTAIFAPVYLTVSGGSFGPVSISPPGVVCTFASDALTGAPAPCRFPYPLDALVTITRDPAAAPDPPHTWTGACGGVEITCRVRMRRDQSVGAGLPPLAAAPGPGQTMRFGYAGPKGGKITVSEGGRRRTCRRTCTLGGFSRDSRIRVSASGSKKVKFVKWSDVKAKKSSRAIYVGDPTAVQATFKKKRR